jgi:hypothetical protein
MIGGIAYAIVGTGLALLELFEDRRADAITQRGRPQL